MGVTSAAVLASAPKLGSFPLPVCGGGCVTVFCTMMDAGSNDANRLVQSAAWLDLTRMSPFPEHPTRDLDCSDGTVICYHRVWPPRGVSCLWACSFPSGDWTVRPLATAQESIKTSQGSSRGVLAGTVRVERNSTNWVDRPRPLSGLHHRHCGWTAAAASGHHLVSAGPNRQWNRPRLSGPEENKQQLCAPPALRQGAEKRLPTSPRALPLSFIWSSHKGFPGGARCEESPINAGDIRDGGSIPGSGRSPGGRQGNPLQCSCLENPVDRGAWRSMVHGVTRSQTRLMRLSMNIIQGQVWTTVFRDTCLGGQNEMKNSKAVFTRLVVIFEVQEVWQRMCTWRGTTSCVSNLGYHFTYLFCAFCNIVEFHKF